MSLNPDIIVSAKAQPQEHQAPHVRGAFCLHAICINIIALQRIKAGRSRNFSLFSRARSGADHKNMLSDQDFADTIFLLIEGALISTSIYKSTAELKKARYLVEKFL